MAERLGRYAVIKRLAAGGMGEIFLAEHTGLSGFAKRVAIKRIRPDLVDDPAYIAFFLNEARLGSFLNHPNIVHIFDVGREGDALWLVMEYVEGIDLKRLARRADRAGHRLPPAAVVAAAIEVLSALEEAHAGGPLGGEPIIHRDLSPENVLVAKSGAVKVLDFGLAKWAPGARAVSSSEGGLIFGKVRYMPPEQLRGSMIDVRADVFAMGAVMYEVLSGELPFGPEDANRVLAAILKGRPPPPTARHEAPDPELDALVYRAIEPDPSKRYQTAKEMRRALVGYLRDRGVGLPLEDLRQLMHSDLLGRDDEGDIPAAPEAKVTPKRCGKCGGRFTAHFLDGQILDRCLTCRGVWFDQLEVERVLGRPRASLAPGEAPASPAPLDRLRGSCPECRIELQAFRVPKAQVSIEVCPRCFGTWFDHGEVELLEREEVLVWLKGVLDALSRGKSS